ncbi:MAG: M48 family metallopeptidase [Longimicrobiales bacterium]
MNNVNHIRRNRPWLHTLRAFAAAGAIGIVAGGCATAISPEQEAQIGAQSAADINSKLPIVRDATLNNYINSLGSQIAGHGQRHIGYRFYIVNSNAVNAFAVPGGYVYVNRGLIERTTNASELVGVLAHEIEHVELRHSVQQMEQMQKANIGVALASILLSKSSAGVQQAAGTAVNVAGSAYFAKFSRQDEMEADEGAVPLMVSSGYNPNGLTTMFQKLLAEGQRSPSSVEQWFSTHPTTQDRVANSQRLVSAVPAATRSRLSTDTKAFQSFKSRMRSYSPRATD